MNLIQIFDKVMGKLLQGKTALVTGGSRGIGAAIAKRFAEEGADIAITYYSSEEKAKNLVNELKASGVKASAFKIDHGDLSQAESLIEQVIEKFGQLDILVNNAGIYAGGSFADPNADAKALSRIFDVNVNGVAALVRAAAKHLPENGRIITIGSINAQHVPMPGAADYSASKSALVGYTKGWARDFGFKKITANLIQLGPVDTDMNPANSDFAHKVIPHIPLGRYGKPEEIASVAAFFAGPESSYINGAIVNVDGGASA